MDLEDSEGLAHWAKFVANNIEDSKKVITNARQVAVKNSYMNQIPLWEKFMKGFVDK